MDASGREGRGQGEGPAVEARKGRGRARGARLALFLGAAFSVVAGLECKPSPHASSKKQPEAPLITAEARPRFPRSPHANPRWSWPGMAQFQSAYDQADRQAKPIRLVYGRLVKDADGDHAEVDDVVLSIEREAEGETHELQVEFAATDEAYDQARLWNRHGWKLATGPMERAAAGVPLVFERGSSRVRIEPTYVSSEGRIPMEALDAWSYVAALLASDPPVYDANRASFEEDAAEKIAAARAAGDKEKALSYYRVWRPMGRCSMDSRPAQVAREYAELCYEMGKLGCFLQLQLRIMGDQFARVAYSSYGEASHATEAERLTETGLDVDTFLLGLALRFSGVSREGELGGSRLVRSIKESGRAAPIAARLATWAKDATFDEYSRLTATQIVALLEEDAALADEEELSEIARLWLARHRAKK
ncbi:hypothetical protein [Polyangium sp. 6x1]|uniref:hypothetical protein n=1 Tax=Polyangium sp. 6x1 TaxID=3042689 RepID=UPI002482B7F8|nr:hypothetical protein [Polyangium sp. 6x1]MDI1450493.1 hypothetical protein [Polyangium sp. 6x1]